MKKLMMTLIAMVTMTISAQAMSYEQAREQALFLTDKMAYELNLTEDQYEAAYEVNLDYLLGVETEADLYGDYWTRRNLDLSYILLDWQYNAFCAASYFYRPLYWSAGFWHFGIYARYPHRTYFYFGRPNFWYTYRGGHAWHRVGGRGWYYGRTFGRPHRVADNHRGFGMRNGFDRGDYRGRSGNFNHNDRGRVGQPNRGNNRPADVNRGSRPGNVNHGSRPADVNRSSRPGNVNRDSRPANVNRGSRPENVNRSSEGSSRGSHSGAYNRQSSTRETVGHGSSESKVSTPSRSSSPSRSFSSSRSTSGSSSHSGGSFHNGGSRSGNFGGGSSHSHGGGSHGGRR